MDLKKKLDYYRSETKNQPTVHDAAVHALQQELGGEICAPSAPYLKISRQYELSAPAQLQLKNISKGIHKNPIPLENCLFFDLETTGLAGGTGTFPFLLGFGYFFQNKFIVDLFFLPDFGREYYLFQYLQEFFKRFQQLVSFNGKSFDLPLLKNRFILNRIKVDWQRFAHIDLLHLARRLWRDSYPSLDLQTIEKHLLNRNRQDDIPGAQIPEAYFSFIKTGVIHQISRIIEHNYLDIVSLADLILLINAIEKEPQNVQDENVLIRIGRLHYDSGNLIELKKIEQIFKQRNKPVPPGILLAHSLLTKRRQQWLESVAIWEQISQNRDYHFRALEELAKYYEHRCKKYERALEYTDRALKNIRQLQELDPYRIPPELYRSFAERAQRLKRKMS